MYENYLAELRMDMQLTDEFSEFYSAFERNDLNIFHINRKNKYLKN